MEVMAAVLRHNEGFSIDDYLKNQRTYFQYFTEMFHTTPTTDAEKIIRIIKCWSKSAKNFKTYAKKLEEKFNLRDLSAPTSMILMQRKTLNALRECEASTSPDRDKRLQEQLIQILCPSEVEATMTHHAPSVPATAAGKKKLQPS